jgi:hypothetical protein
MSQILWGNWSLCINMVTIVVEGFEVYCEFTKEWWGGLV